MKLVFFFFQTLDHLYVCNMKIIEVGHSECEIIVRFFQLVDKVEF